MLDRIKKIMELEDLPPTKFADKLQINRGVISHILNGRNNPSLEVVSKILSEMEYVNPDWLINGKGNMYKEGFGNFSNGQSSMQADLFNQNAVSSQQTSAELINNDEIGVKESIIQPQYVVNKVIESPEKCARKVTQIIIYYDDNTFETFFSNQIEKK